MGKRILVQRRGRGGSVYRASTHKRIAPAKYPPVSNEQMEGKIEGEVVRVRHEPGRFAPLAQIRLETGQSYHFIVPE